MQIIEKNAQVIGVGDPGAGGSGRFDTDEKLPAEAGQFCHELPQFFLIFNIDFFMISPFFHFLT